LSQCQYADGATTANAAHPLLDTTHAAKHSVEQQFKRLVKQLLKPVL